MSFPLTFRREETYPRPSKAISPLRCSSSLLNDSKESPPHLVLHVIPPNFKARKDFTPNLPQPFLHFAAQILF